MKALVKNTGLMGMTQITLIGVSMIRNKYLAVMIGPEGFGMFNLLQGFFSLADIFIGIYLATGSVKYVSQYTKEENHEAVQSIFDVSFSLVFLLSSIATLLFFVSFSFVQVHFLTKDVLYQHYALYAASYMGTILGTVFDALLQGLRKTKAIAARQFYTSLFSFGSVILLVYFFDLTGFFLNVALASFFSLFMYWKEARKHVKIRVNFKPKDKTVVKRLLSFTGINFFLGISRIGSDFGQRWIVVNFMSLGALGLVSAATSLNKYLNILNDGAKYYVFPRMSEVLEPEERSTLLNDYLRMHILFSMLASTAAILIAPILIKVFYSDRFKLMGDYYWNFVIAQFILGIHVGYMWAIVGLGRMKFYSISTIIGHSLAVIIPFFFLRQLGVVCLAYAAIVSTGIQIVMNASFLHIREKVHINRTNVQMLLFSAAAFTVSVMAREINFLLKIPILLAIGGSMLFFTTKEEREKVVGFIRQKIRLPKTA